MDEEAIVKKFQKELNSGTASLALRPISGS